MAVNISLTTHFTVTIDGKVYDYGSLTEPETVTLSSDEVQAGVYSVANGASVQLWDDADAVGADFKFLWVKCDKGTDAANLVLILDNTADDEVHEVPLYADIPFVLAGDDLDADTIGNITVKNNSGETAKVEYFVGL